MKKRWIALNLALLLILALLPMQVAAADQEIEVTIGQSQEIIIPESGEQWICFTAKEDGGYSLYTQVAGTGSDNWYHVSPSRVMIYSEEGTMQRLHCYDHYGNSMREYEEIYLLAGKRYAVQLEGAPGTVYKVTVSLKAGIQNLQLENEYSFREKTEDSAYFEFQAGEDGLYAFSTLWDIDFDLLGVSEPLKKAQGMMLLNLKKGDTCRFRLGATTYFPEYFFAASFVAWKVEPQPYTLNEKQDVSYGQALQLEMKEPEERYLVGFNRTPASSPFLEDVLYEDENGDLWEVTVIHSPDFYIFDENCENIGANTDISSMLGGTILSTRSFQMSPNKTYYIVPNYLAECNAMRVTTYWENPFQDVPFAAWYYDAVRYTYENGLFAGVTNYQFAPDTAMNRAMLVSVLYRMAGSPDVTGLEQPFTDVVSGSWYEKAVSWAADVGVVAGVSSDRFAPNDLVTREQMVSMLYRYVQKVEKQPADARADLQGFTDQNQISNYALEPMQWAVAEEIVHGVTPTTLAPKQSTTRAQAAMLLMGLQK